MQETVLATSIQIVIKNVRTGACESLPFTLATYRVFNLFVNGWYGDEPNFDLVVLGYEMKLPVGSPVSEIPDRPADLF